MVDNLFGCRGTFRCLHVDVDFERDRVATFGNGDRGKIFSGRYVAACFSSFGHSFRQNGGLEYANATKVFLADAFRRMACKLTARMQVEKAFFKFFIAAMQNYVDFLAVRLGNDVTTGKFSVVSYGKMAPELFRLLRSSEPDELQMASV
jgi:hypothetical protein